MPLLILLPVLLERHRLSATSSWLSVGYSVNICGQLATIWPQGHSCTCGFSVIAAGPFYSWNNLGQGCGGGQGGPFLSWLFPNFQISPAKSKIILSLSYLNSWGPLKNCLFSFNAYTVELPAWGDGMGMPVFKYWLSQSSFQPDLPHRVAVQVKCVCVEDKGESCKHCFELRQAKNVGQRIPLSVFCPLP